MRPTVPPNVEISQKELDRLAEEAARILAGGEVDPDFEFSFDFEGETRTEQPGSSERWKLCISSISERRLDRPTTPADWYRYTRHPSRRTRRWCCRGKRGNSQLAARSVLARS